MQDNENAPLFKEAVVLRHERALIYGYPNQASLGMKDNMVKDPEAARRLLGKFRERVTRIGVLDSLMETKRNDPAAKDKTFYFWDEDYYTRIWKAAAYSIDQTKISEYFPLQSSVRGMFDIFETLFGIVVEKANVNLWHEDAELYSVWDNGDSGGNFSGYIYLDLYKRPGKYGGGKYFLKLAQE
jgi:metallopeptidase MepB